MQDAVPTYVSDPNDDVVKWIRGIIPFLEHIADQLNEDYRSALAHAIDQRLAEARRLVDTADAGTTQPHDVYTEGEAVSSSCNSTNTMR